MTIYTEHRADGWPLCPQCGEDELWSRFAWYGDDPKPPMQAWIGHGLRCYKCGWDSTQALIRAHERFYPEQWERAIELLNSAQRRSL